MTDPSRLQRFVDAQDTNGTYDAALRELREGRKRTHWMWFVFPQVAGLGRSSMAQAYALAGVAEAHAYLAHPVLGPRLLECLSALLGLPGSDAVHVFGEVDGQKLWSCVTLLAETAPDEQVFSEVLDRYFGGQPDPGTLSLL